MNRRNFLKTAAVTAAAGMAGGSSAALAAPKGADELTAAEKAAIRNYTPDMRYRRMGSTGVMVSALGFGMLRLPMLEDRKTVNEAATIEMLRYGIDNGINYVDTARGYLGGQSETAVGMALAGGWRDRVWLATKLTLSALKSDADFERMFDLSRKQLNTDVIDFYLLHHVTEKTWRENMVPYRAIEKIMKLKEQGKIRYAGFSFHDSLPFFKQVLDANPGWDFCQLMENYLDTEYEAGFLGMKMAYERGMAVNVMEPLKAGMLTRLPKEVRALFDASGRKRTAVEWAFDYLYTLPEPGVVISGMSSVAHVKENIEYAKRSHVGMLDWQDRVTIGKAAHLWRTMPGVSPCTACANCMPCHNDVDIARLIGHVWFSYKLTGNLDAAKRYYTHVPPPRGVSAEACDFCGECVPRCPEHVDIVGILKEMRGLMA
ncbi:MAG: aldo/keto reductase [Desulfovibrionaceae bacterium]|nr:aldo/keto reductase [Desulfovibrionaceae bacterium]